LIGAGGGFLLVPILLLLYPNDNPATISSISLAVVFLNAASGSIAYLRHRKVDVRSALWFSATALPASILGAMAVARIPRTTFELILSVVLILASIFLLVSRREHASLPPAGEVDRLGPQVAHSRAVGMALSFVVGFISSLLGIRRRNSARAGHGACARLPGAHCDGHVAFRVGHHAGAGTAVHLIDGSLQSGWHRTIPLGVGVVIGAQSARVGPDALDQNSSCVAWLRRCCLLVCASCITHWRRAVRDAGQITKASPTTSRRPALR